MLGKVFAVALSEHKVVQSRSSIQLTSKLHLTCQPFITRLQPRQIKLFKAQSIRIKCVLSEKTPNSTTAPSIQSIDQTLPPPAPCPLSSTQSFMLKGTGMDVQWEVCWRSDGSFMETIQGPVSCSWGYEGGKNGGGSCWEIDASGCVHPLSLDDKESALLSALVRTGAWQTHPDVEIISRKKLNPAISSNNSTPAATELVVLKLKGGRVITDLYLRTVPSGNISTTTSSSSIDSSSSSSIDKTASSIKQQQEDEEGEDWVVLPVRMRHQMAVDIEQTIFENWTATSLANTQNNNNNNDISIQQYVVYYPEKLLHDPGSGEMNTYTTQGGITIIDDDILEAAAVLQSSSAVSLPGGLGLRSGSPYAMPEMPLLPEDAAFLAEASNAVPAWFTPSGHVLVKPSINGQEVGLFILDTGASCFVIEPAVAERLHLPGFGGLHVTGMTGKVRSKFRQATSITLGPLTMDNPIMVEMPCTGLARGAPEPVVGIIGQEIFRRAVVVIPPPPPKPVLPPLPPLDPENARGVSSPGQAMAANMYQSAQSAVAVQAVRYNIYLYSPEHDVDDVDCSGRSGVNREREASVTSSDGSSSTAIHAGTGAALSSSTDTSTHAVSGRQQAGSGRSPGVGGAAGVDKWVPLEMICGLPHIEVQVTADEGSDPTSALLMLDTGAGGVALMLNSRGVAALNLNQDSESESEDEDQSPPPLQQYLPDSVSPIYTLNTSSTPTPDMSTNPSRKRKQRPARKVSVIRGVGGDSSNTIRTERRQLRHVTLGSLTFDDVSGLCAMAAGVGGGLELSHYGQGILCGDLLRRCVLTVDFPRRRLGIEAADS